MDKMVIIILAALVVLIIIAVAAAARAARARYSAYLAGYWVGTPEFLERAKLRDFQLFISEAKNGKRDGYLIVVDADGDFAANSPVSLSLSPRGRSAARAATQLRDSCSGAARFDGEVPMPRSLNFKVSMFAGSLVLCDEREVYAVLSKDQEASAAALAAY